MKIRILVAVGLLALGGVAHAEGGCPQGQTPRLYGDVWGCAPGGTDAPIQEQQPAAPQPTGEWKTMWGSIATDGPKGILGSASNMANEHLAESTALAECRKKGGNPCKVETTYSNQCSALVTGDKVFVVRLGSSEQDAANLGMQKCASEDTNCRVYFSSCSKPQFMKY